MTQSNKSQREKLLRMRQGLQEIAATADQSSAVVELDQSKMGRLSRMDAIQAQAMAQASGHRREATLLKISAALKRIDDDDYGACLSCDEAIHPNRLEFDPTATLCIGCARSAES